MNKTTLSIALLATTGGIVTARTYQNSIGLSIGTLRLRALDQLASPLC